MYSEYIDQFGANCETPSFEDWAKQTAQNEKLEKNWMAINQKMGLTNFEGAVAA